ncbi:MAG: hypothetical protein AAF184_23985 [Pseudomonadota bacterium]
MRKGAAERERSENRWKAHLKALQEDQPSQPTHAKPKLFRNSQQLDGNGNTRWWLHRSGKPAGDGAARDYRAALAAHEAPNEDALYPKASGKPKS